MKRLFLFCILVLTVLMASAQQKDYPIENKDGVPCYRYEVQRGEGLYRISINFGVTQEELIQFNPSLQSNGLKYGQTIFIPVKEQVNTDNYETHVVEQGETLYSLSRKFNVSIDELKRLNPVTHTNLPAGAKIFIRPKAMAARVNQDKPAIVKPIAEAKDSVHATDSLPYSEVRPIVLPFLPLDSSPTDTFTEPADTLQEDSLMLPKPLRLAFFIPININAPKRDISNDRFLYFYEGALLAIREMQIGGQRMEVHFIDNGAPTFLINEELKKNGMDSLDAIIGHFSDDNMAILSPFCRQHKTMLLIPFSNKSDSTTCNPYILQFNPTMPKGQKANMFHSEENGNWAAFTKLMKQYFNENKLDKQSHRYDILGYDLTMYIVRALAAAQTASTAEEQQAAFENIYEGLQSNMVFRRMENGGFMNQPEQIIAVPAE